MYLPSPLFPLRTSLTAAPSPVATAHSALTSRQISIVFGRLFQRDFCRILFAFQIELSLYEICKSFQCETISANTRNKAD